MPNKAQHGAPESRSRYPLDLVEAAMEELEHTSAFKTLWQSEAIYLDGICHALGDEYLSSLVKLKEIYDITRRTVAHS